MATCTTSYDVHKSQFLRLEGTKAWAEISPSYGYHGNHLKWSYLESERETEIVPQIEEKDQFALEMDHFAECILESKTPHTPGEEGLKDHRTWKQFTNLREPAELLGWPVDSSAECLLQSASWLRNPFLNLSQSTFLHRFDLIFDR